MGNDVSNPIRNIDKRTARREYRDDFIKAIDKFKNKYILNNKNTGNKSMPPHSSSTSYKATITNTNTRANCNAVTWQDGNIKVYIRKRPIFKHELTSYEFDVISCKESISRNQNGSSCSSSDNSSIMESIIVHDCRMHADMKRQIINHHEFQFNKVFDEYTTNPDIYHHTTKSLVAISCDGGYSTCLVYGQTGDGDDDDRATAVALYIIFHMVLSALCWHYIILYLIIHIFFQVNIQMKILTLF